MTEPRPSPPAGQRSAAGSQSRQAASRTLQLLEAIAAAGATATLVALARATGMPQATAFRLCQKLEEEGYLTRDGGSRRYAIGSRLMRLGLDIARNSGAVSGRHAILSALVESVGETCNLTTLVGTEVMYLDRVETRWPLRLALEPGSRVPLHCTASGKLLLAAMGRAERQALLKGLDLGANTPRTITDRAALEKDLQRIARQGYSTDNEEFITGLVAVAVPIRGRDGAVFAAVACHAPIARLTHEAAIGLVPRLQQAAARLAETFA